MPTNANFDLDLLRTFVAVAEKQTFVEAASVVFRTEAAVSQQMQRLEVFVGKELLVKKGRSKALTHSGIQLLAYARKLLQLNDEVCMAMNAESLAGVLRLGAPDDITNTILPHLLSRFSKAYPQLMMEIQVDRSPFLMEKLKRGDIDLAISAIDITEHPRIQIRRSSTHWYAAEDYVFEKHLPVPLVVLNDPSIYRNVGINSLNEAGIPWRIAYVTTTLAGAKAAVAAGLGITPRSMEFISPGLKTLHEADGFPRLPDFNFYLYMRSDNTMKVAQVLFDSLRAQGFSDAP